MPQKVNFISTCQNCGFERPYSGKRTNPQAGGNTLKSEVPEKGVISSQLPDYDHNDRNDHSMKDRGQKEQKVQDAAIRIGRESSISSSIINSERVDPSPGKAIDTSIEEYFARLGTSEEEEGYNYPFSTKEKIEWVHKKYPEHGWRGPEPMDTDGSTSRSQNQTKTQETENSKDSVSQKRGRPDDNDKSDGGDDNQSDKNRPPRKLRRNKFTRSLNGRLACPFAKADPNLYLSCVSIGRKNLPGVKEHVRRNHFNTSNPPGLLAAKNWKAVFDFCNPSWPPREYPSPYVDMREIFFNAVNWNSITTSHGEGQEEVDYTYHSLNTTIKAKSSQPKACTLPELRPGPTDITQAFQPQPQSQDDKPTTPVTSQFQTMTTNNVVRTLGDPSDHNVSISESVTPLKPIASPPGSLGCGMCSLIQGTCYTCSFNSDPNELNDPPGWGFSTGISPTLKKAITRMVSLDLDNLLADDIQIGLHLSETFIEKDLGIDTTLPPEDNYYAVISSIDPNGEVFDPNTNFLMPNPQHQSLLISGVSISSDQNPPSPSTSFPSITTSGIQIPMIDTQSRPLGHIENRKKYLLLISRRPADPNSTEGRRWKRFTFDSFGEFRNTFESWLKSAFTDPEFCWRRMEFYNDKERVRLVDIDDVIDDLEGSFCQYRSNDASLFLVMKDGS
ncbi:hypothetical protein H072_10936 [Dactylellina haptotyla CBS 200.50]|uniref:Uncharacterized protein n=1 Tax=Dactylellina haptotyla (strain CBS 200.50) TaxID=1284197 RepID=S8BK83_DACHA|nr:hypothetical protein H072_10936 [Dactylellina haptotyla CBS 200.50]